jgi:DNA-binding XRE family transcriptional regulator
MMSPSDAGLRLRAARKAKGLTQEALAQALGVTRSAVAQWETGRSRIDLKRDRIERVIGPIGDRRAGRGERAATSAMIEFLGKFDASMTVGDLRASLRDGTA